MIYEAALHLELKIKGLSVHRQSPVQLLFKGVATREPLFIHNVVEDKLLIEVKATEVTRLMKNKLTYNYDFSFKIRAFG